MFPEPSSAQVCFYDVCMEGFRTTGCPPFIQKLTHAFCKVISVCSLHGLCFVRAFNKVYALLSFARNFINYVPFIVITCTS